MFQWLPRIPRHYVAIVAAVTIVHTILFVLTATLLSAYGGSIWGMVDGDRNEYFILAHSMIAEHNFALVSSIPDTFRTPGYPAILVALYLLVSDSFVAVAVMLALFTGITAALIAYIAETLMSRRAGYLATALYTLSIGTVYASVSGQGSDVIYTTLYMLATAIVLAVGISNRRPVLAALGIGVILAAATYTRPIGLVGSFPIFVGLLLVPALSQVSIRARIKHAGIAFLIFIVSLLPWCIRNYVVTDHFLFSSLPAFNFVEYNIPLFLAFWTDRPEVEIRREIRNSIGNPLMDPLRNAEYADEMNAIMFSFLREYAVPYSFFHAFKAIPFFVGSSLHNLHGALVAEAPDLRLSIFPTDQFNITSALLEGNIAGIFTILKKFWVVTLERVAWVFVFLLAFLAPLLARGLERRFLLIVVGIILWHALLSSPVATPRYRVPAEPFIVIAALYSARYLWIQRDRYFFRTTATNETPNGSVR